VLLRWPQLPISPLEQLEKLEQLRLIEAGIRIDTLEVEGDQYSADTPKQLEQARAIAAMMPPQADPPKPSMHQATGTALSRCLQKEASAIAAASQRLDPGHVKAALPLLTSCAARR